MRSESNLAPPNNRNHQLSDIIDEIAILQGQVIWCFAMIIWAFF